MTFQIKQDEMTLSTIDRMNQKLISDAINDSIVTLDLSKVKMIDLEGISWIVNNMSQLERKGITLEVINDREEVYNFFQITKLNTSLDIKLGT